ICVCLSTTKTTPRYANVDISPKTLPLPSHKQDGREGTSLRHYYLRPSTMSERCSACQVSVKDKGKKNSHEPSKSMSIPPPVSRKKLRGANEIIKYSGRARATALDRTGLDWTGLDWTGLQARLPPPPRKVPPRPTINQMIMVLLISGCYTCMSLTQLNQLRAGQDTRYAHTQVHTQRERYRQGNDDRGGFVLVMNNKDAPMRAPPCCSRRRSRRLHVLLHTRGTGRLWWVVVDGGVERCPLGCAYAMVIESRGSRISCGYHIIS
ncbi:uncharacterized protein K489DRAFT_426186, partial [Dissoconium aciculare CBS 342.82]|uniref:Uncharacterized protein n=1 Tax=Dissoconium aciculare CBS 342.82 TaxID=1314786 RepID=A0A6J3M0F8_9PEZI